MPRRKEQHTSSLQDHKKIEEQTSEFLKSGGKITKIPYGASGLPSITDKNKSLYGRNIRGSIFLT
ncbi:hypothetical protein H0A36_18975 [Endozoicomonas sp. SM1973]|uniref:Transcriptional regulator SutA RNAP-binding domain-containing protein n=1 Tax=Spartinivicinus marinus TaxID=2994442 RepID=A0A853I417_9GAMM|nr:hypothetical protein [Spartinivicinus marinus]MCX4025918.1 hypothetical protein [Spartinivicinus marinus]NYZ68103.1 hypothetical protein [Spartinivicinus marinus]